MSRRSKRIWKGQRRGPRLTTPQENSPHITKEDLPIAYSRWRRAVMDSGLHRKTKETLFEDMILDRQAQSRALNAYRQGGSWAIAASLYIIRAEEPPEAEVSHIIAWDLANEADVYRSLYMSTQDDADSFSILRLPPGYRQGYDIKERLLDVTAAGVLAVRGGVKIGDIQAPYELEEVATQVNAFSGVTVRLFESAHMPEGCFAAVASEEKDKATEIVSFTVKDDSLQGAKGLVETLDLGSEGTHTDQLLIQSVYAPRPLELAHRDLLEELMANTAAIRSIPNAPVRGTLTF